jgi:(p)ppGpp synthase/HD superfamily hydrolase
VKRLSPRFAEALQFAYNLHNGQMRKQTDTPYIAHLLGVTSLVLENGGDERQAIAALLHDAVEDAGGLATLEKIRQAFGEQVAEIVDGCTDSYQTPKPPWLERKKAYLKRLPETSPATHLVSLADKVHNSRAILYDLRREGDLVFARFTGGKPGTLWYYRSLADFFTKNYPSPLSDELQRTVDEIGRLAPDDR